MRAACRASSTRTPLTPSAAAMNFQPESIPAKGSPSLLSSKRTSVTWLSQPDLKPFRRSHMRSEEHTSELQSLMRISYAVFCLKNKIHIHIQIHTTYSNIQQTSLQLPTT